MSTRVSLPELIWTIPLNLFVIPNLLPCRRFGKTMRIIALNKLHLIKYAADRVTRRLCF